MITASARHILVDDKQHCIEIKSAIESGSDFASLAKKFSNCPSSLQGGALGSFSQGQMIKEFDDLAFSAELNKVVGPVRTQFGYHLVEITRRTEN